MNFFDETHNSTLLRGEESPRMSIEELLDMAGSQFEQIGEREGHLFSEYMEVFLKELDELKGKENITAFDIKKISDFLKINSCDIENHLARQAVDTAMLALESAKVALTPSPNEWPDDAPALVDNDPEE